MRLSEKSGCYHNIYLLLPKHLQYDLAADKSAFFLDRETNELVMAVIRPFAARKEVVAWALAAAERYTLICASTWKDDPGVLTLTSYTAGSQSTPTFDWVRNLRTRTKEVLVSAPKYKEAISSVFALFWNLLLHKQHD